MLGNFLTSIICGLVVFVTLMVVGVPFAGLWALWVALVDFLPMIGGALAGIPTVLFALTHSFTAGLVTLIVFLIYTQFENHVLNPIIMSRTVRISPLLVLISVLVGASIGSWIGGIFGGFVAALLAIPAAGAFQVIVREAWRLSGPPLREIPDAAGTDSDPSPIPGTAAAEAEDEAENAAENAAEDAAEDAAATESATIPANQHK
jgi:predicted PurR-regulated permease PerM